MFANNEVLLHKLARLSTKRLCEEYHERMVTHDEILKIGHDTLVESLQVNIRSTVVTQTKWLTISNNNDKYQ